MACNPLTFSNVHKKPLDAGSAETDHVLSDLFVWSLPSS